MEITETREEIKRRLQATAVRLLQTETEYAGGTFDPLVDLLFGAFAVEIEKVSHSIEASRSRITERLMRMMVPELYTGTVPAHSVMQLRPIGGELSVGPEDQFTSPGNDVTFSPAGHFALSGAVVKIIASGRRVDRIGTEMRRETIASLPADDKFQPGMCWLGIDVSASDSDAITLFVNWPSVAERIKNQSKIRSIRVNMPGSLANINAGLAFDPSGTGIGGVTDRNDQMARAFYAPHFITVSGICMAKAHCTNVPPEWNAGTRGIAGPAIDEQLVWLKLECPPAIPAGDVDNMVVTTDCVPVVNRRRIHQRGRLQPLFNVFALKHEQAFIGIDRVSNGDGDVLVHVDEITPGADDTYILRQRNLARFDARDAFEKLTDLTASMRDDLSAFSALDNSILTTHLETLKKGTEKIKEHLGKFDFELPTRYLMVRTRSAGQMLDVYFWESLGSAANGITPFQKLVPGSQNVQKSTEAQLLLPVTGGRDEVSGEALRARFREAVMTRGRLVTVEDFKTAVKNLPGLEAADVAVCKKLSIAESIWEGVRTVVEVEITPSGSNAGDEEFWLQTANMVKTNLLARSTGALPLVIVVKGFPWKL